MILGGDGSTTWWGERKWGGEGGRGGGRGGRGRGGGNGEERRELERGGGGEMTLNWARGEAERRKTFLLSALPKKASGGKEAGRTEGCSRGGASAMRWRGAKGGGRERKAELQPW